MRPREIAANMDSRMDTRRRHSPVGANARPVSAGILLYRRCGREPEVLLVLPGGPYWRGKHLGAWQIPKGRMNEDETPADAAFREFEEETGTHATGTLIPLPSIRQAGGKQVLAFALEGDLDPNRIVSNRFEIPWPPGSGRTESFPEIARASWFRLSDAPAVILASQRPLLASLAAFLHG